MNRGTAPASRRCGSQRRISRAHATARRSTAHSSRAVTTLDLFERIADGLGMPARMHLGLAPQHPAGLDHLGASGRAEILAVYPSQSAALKDIHGLARTAREIEVLAVRGLGILGLNDSMPRAAIQRSGPAVHVLLLDPDCPATERRAAEIGEGYASFAAGIRLSIERLRELDAETGAVRLSPVHDAADVAGHRFGLHDVRVRVRGEPRRAYQSDVPVGRVAAWCAAPWVPPVHRRVAPHRPPGRLGSGRGDGRSRAEGSCA